MLGRPVTSVIPIAVLAVLAFVGNGTRVQAGFVPSNNVNKSSDWLSASDKDAPELGSAGQSTSCAPATLEPIENPLPSPDYPDSPLARRNLLNTYFGILDGRGNSSSGAGGSNNRDNSGGSGTPIDGSIVVLNSAPARMGYALIDPNAIPPTSVSTRLFRPPRRT